MPDESKKITLIITLTAVAVLISMVDVLGFIFSVREVFNFYNHFLYEIRFIFWGWLLALISAVAAIGMTLYWKPGRVLFRRIIIFLSVASIIFALLLLFGLIMIYTLKF